MVFLVSLDIWKGVFELYLHLFVPFLHYDFLEITTDVFDPLLTHIHICYSRKS